MGGLPIGGEELNYFAPKPITPQSSFWPIDIRSAGLEGITAWVTGYNTLSKALAFLDECSLVAIQELDEKNILRSDWLFRRGPADTTGQPSFIYRIWIDTTAEYFPIKAEIYSCATDESGEVTQLGSKPVSVTDVGWEEKGARPSFCQRRRKIKQLPIGD